MRFWFSTAALCLLLSAGCGDAQKTQTDGLGRACDHDDDCEPGQACTLTSRTPEGNEITTCQIPCKSSSDCPEGYTCRSGQEQTPASICVKE